MSNLTVAVRGLRQSPGLSIVAILTIAVGIGANTALFSIYDRLVLNPVTIPTPSTLVAIWASNPQLNFNAPAVSWPRYEEIRDQARTFVSVGISAFDKFTLTGNGDPQQLDGLRVSATFFPTLGILPASGRNFSPSEDVPNGPAVCVISHELWQSRFGGRPMIGETITLNTRSWEVVGIMPPRLTAPFNQVQVFAPRVFDVGGLTTVQIQNGAGYAQPIARLKHGVTLAQARDDLTSIAATSRARVPTRLDANNTSEPRLFAEALVGNLTPTFNALNGAVTFVLLIACANVTALFLSRLTSRHREIAVRQSLGATRGCVVRQFIVESLVVCSIAGLAGALLARWALTAIQSLVASQLPPNTVLTLNPRALTFTAVVSLLTALLVGLVPAIQASRSDVVEALQDTARGSSSARGSALRSMLIVAEVALSVVLVVGSTLLLASFIRLQRTPPGFEPKGTAAAFVGLPADRYSTSAQQARFFEAVVERLQAEPGVTDAAAAIGIPMAGSSFRVSYGVAGRALSPLPQRPLANLGIVTDHYFALMRIPIVEGRAFDQRDRDGSPAVCIINESFARRLFPGESPLGKVMLRWRDTEIRTEIVGIIRDVKTDGLNVPAPDEIYYPVGQHGRQGMAVLARTSGDPAQMQSAIRSAVAAVDRNQPISFFTTLETRVANSLGVQRIVASLTTVFAALALALSALGLYAIVAYGVSQRTSEIGIRMALGAQPVQVVRLVMRSGLTLVAIGLVIGLAAAAGAARLIQALLFDIRPLDPVVYAGVAVLFTFVASLACVLPSLRASRIDPVLALRGE